MRLIERDGMLYVRDVVWTQAFYWPLLLSVVTFVEQHGQERLSHLLAGEFVYDEPGDSPDFMTRDGIKLPVPHGGATLPAWKEQLPLAREYFKKEPRKLQKEQSQ